MIEKQTNNTHNIALGTGGGGSLLRFGSFAAYNTQATQATAANTFTIKHIQVF